MFISSSNNSVDSLSPKDFTSPNNNLDFSTCASNKFGGAVHDRHANLPKIKSFHTKNLNSKPSFGSTTPTRTSSPKNESSQKYVRDPISIAKN